MMDKDEAERIRARRGNYEVEVSFTGEAGLHESQIGCKKNPNHQKFIPVKDFNIKHLPSRYRDKLLEDLVRVQSDLTCRLSRISKDRPGDKGQNSTMAGTGWVGNVYKYTEEINKNCQCDECLRPGTHTPKKAWGLVYITTASHVVCDSEEAKHTKCHFFYDSHETDINKVPTLTGGKIVCSDVTGDLCMMKYVTYDVELLDRLVEMYRRWQDLRHKVLMKYVYNTNVDHDLCIIVSHPHGCSKVVSVGAWTDRHVVNKRDYNINNNCHGEDITYSYNTPTCPGSSGAAVVTLYKDRRDSFANLLPHCQGRLLSNDNYSGVGYELVLGQAGENARIKGFC